MGRDAVVLVSVFSGALLIDVGKCLSLNWLRPRQNGCLFAYDTFKSIFWNENIRISTKISLKFVPKGLINNIPALVLIMAWRGPGDKPLSEPMLVRSLTYICVTRPQWVKPLSMIDKSDCELLLGWHLMSTKPYFMHLDAEASNFICSEDILNDTKIPFMIFSLNRMVVLDKSRTQLVDTCNEIMFGRYSKFKLRSRKQHTSFHGSLVKCTYKTYH